MSRPNPSTARRVCAGAAVALAVGVVPASALASSGEQLDPVGDAVPALSDFGAQVALVDITRLRVDFDPVAGRLVVAYSGDLNGVGHARLQLRVGLSRLNGTGTCDGQGAPPDFEARGDEVARGYFGFAQTAELYDGAGTLRATGVYENAAETGDGPRLTFTSPALVGQPLRCLTGGWASKAEAGFQTPSTDAVDAFCLDGCPGVAAPAVRRTGHRLAWRRVGAIDSYVVATSTAPEGTPGRTTTYEVVSGTRYTPAPVSGATRYYSVRADVDGAAWSRPEVPMSFRGR